MYKLRSFLTVLGIVFGVSSVIAMLSIGEGASFEAREKIKQLGSHNIIVRSVEPPKESRSQQVARMAVYGLTPSDVAKIKVIPSVETVVPAWERQEDIWHFDKNRTGRIVGTTPEYFEVTDLSAAEGRLLTPIDMSGKSVAVIGSSLKTALFPFANPIGKTIRVKGNYLTVIGVVEPKAFSGSSSVFIAEDINYDVYIPLTTARELFGEYLLEWGGGSSERMWVKLHRLIIKVRDIDKLLATSSLVNETLAGNHKKVDYEILVPLELLKQAEHTKKIFNIVLGSIAAISLVVGGIGIMNIMLAVVTERTREIGIRRALGAKRKDIIYQFLIEAIILSASGGVVGVVVGIAIPRIVTHLSGMTTIVTIWSVLVSLVISVGIGIVFGIYPARRAACLDPIQALRHE